jgi:hypothetical protein
MSKRDPLAVRFWSLLTLLIVCLFTTANLVVAQEYRGSVTGQVVDPAGAFLPGAKVTLTNRASGVSTTAMSNENGLYRFMLVEPGQYTVTVEAANFSKLTKVIEVRVGDSVALDLTVSVVGVQEDVHVNTFDTPLLETNNATLGQVIDARRIAELPLVDGNPLSFARLTAGVTSTGKNVSGEGSIYGGHTSVNEMSINGTQSRGNEFSVNNAPNNQGLANGRTINVSPTVEAIQEFKVVTNTYDAQAGHGGGGSIDATLKSGGNQFHGNVYYYGRNDALNSNQFLNNAAGTKRPPRRYHRYGATIGGPIHLPLFGEGGPALYNGKDRSFFFFSMERNTNVSPNFRERTVPTLAQRGLGATPDYDFSALLGPQLRTSNGTPIWNRDGSPALLGQIYDPFSGKKETWNASQGKAVASSNVERVPIKCGDRLNVICANDPNLSQVGIRWMNAFFPLPNKSPIDAAGRNNFWGDNNQGVAIAANTYYGLKLDHTFNMNHKGTFHYHKIERPASLENWMGIVNGIAPNGIYDHRKGDQTGYDHVATINETTFLNVRAGFSIFRRNNRSTTAGVFDPASLGFSQKTLDLFRGAKYLPNFTFGTYNGATGNGLGEHTNSFIYSFQPMLLKLFGNHTFKVGYDLRSYHDNGSDLRDVAGTYRFAKDYTKRTSASTSEQTNNRDIGQEMAALLFGVISPSSSDSMMPRNIARANQALFHAFYLQDDWKVNPRLTLTMGLRYEYEEPTTERYNRGIRGFDPTISSPVEEQARANYIRNYATEASKIAELPPSAFNVKGGLLYADSNNRGFFSADKNNLQPRVGVAYKLFDKTVLRAGWGIFHVPVVLAAATNTTGYTRNHAIVPSLNNGETFVATLRDPFPTGVPEPPGPSALGYATALGQNVNFDAWDKRNAKVHHWSFGIQHELPRGWLVEANYVATRTTELPVNRNLNAIPRQYLSTSLARNQAVIDNLTTKITNPFLGITVNGYNPFDGSSLLTPTQINKEQLLRPFPQFGDITTQVPDGWSAYHSGQFRIEKRMSSGYTISAGHTWSKLLEKTSFLNATDEEPEKRISPDDSPHRFFASGIYEVPFGKGRRWGNNWNGVMNGFLGGWQINATYQFQRGVPFTWGNIYYNGDPTQIKILPINSKTRLNVFPERDGFYGTSANANQLERNIRYFPTVLNQMRIGDSDIWSIGVMKKHSITEGVKLTFRADAANAFNHPMFDGPNANPRDSLFGSITATRAGGAYRDIQIGLKLEF